ncbi:probable tautomerase [plant metagenome]|uniref:Probable tautomerase n=1 Tax=plant metagenome TaxID=1297885 RepID=A0A484PDW0_9ZZZZ
MPLVHISLRAGTAAAYRQAIFDGVYDALRATFEVPDDDQFMTITEHEPGNFRHGASYLGVARSDAVVFIQITASSTRGKAQKLALFQDVARRLAASPGIRPEDVFVNLVEVARENWSMGNGLAQYA